MRDRPEMWPTSRHPPDVILDVTCPSVRRAKPLLRVRPGLRPPRQLRGVPPFQMPAASSKTCEPSADRRSPPAIAHPHYEELDLKIGGCLPLPKYLKDSPLSILVLRRRTLRPFVPADHVFHLISLSQMVGPIRNRLSLLLGDSFSAIIAWWMKSLRGLAHPLFFLARISS